MNQSVEAKVAVVHTLVRKNITGAKGVDLKPEMDLRAELGAHDLDVLQLIMDVEDEFVIDISDDEAEAVKSVGDMERLACDKLPYRAPAEVARG
jgi:acyl carrier protein